MGKEWIAKLSNRGERGIHLCRQVVGSVKVGGRLVIHFLLYFCGRHNGLEKSLSRLFRSLSGLEPVDQGLAGISLFRGTGFAEELRFLNMNTRL